MKVRPQLRLPARRAATKFVRRRAAWSRGKKWLPISLRWRRKHAIAPAGRSEMRGGVRALYVHLHLPCAPRTTLQGSVREPKSASRASPPPRESTTSMRSVANEFRWMTWFSHATRVHVDRDQRHRVFREHYTRRRADIDETHRFIRGQRTLQRADHSETRRILREYRDIWNGRTQRPIIAPRTRSQASLPVAGARVTATLRAQAVPMLRPVARSIDATEPRQDRRSPAVHPRDAGSHGTPSQRKASRTTQPLLSSPQALACLPELVWRAPTPTPASTAAPTTTARSAPSIDAATEPAAISRIEAALDAPHIRAAVRAQVLDPALVERVADDVIRRIDRRARIERERRGL